MANQKSPFIINLSPEGFSQENVFLLDHKSCKMAAKHAEKLQKFDPEILESSELKGLLRGLAQQSKIWNQDIFPNVVRLSENVIQFAQYIDGNLQNLQEKLREVGKSPQKNETYQKVVTTLRNMMSRSSYAAHNITATSKRVNAYLFVANSETEKLIKFKDKLEPHGMENELMKVRMLNDIPVILKDMQIAWKRVYANVDDLMQRLLVQVEKELAFQAELNVERVVEDWRVLGKQAQAYQKHALTLI